jgi:hypothetical protein
MSTIAAFDKDLKSAAATSTSSDPSTTNSTLLPGELDKDPLEDPDEADNFVEVSSGKPKATRSPKASSTPKGSASAKKRAPTPSTVTNCATLIKFCFFAQHQELNYDNISSALIDGVAIHTSHKLIHKEWAALRHLQAGIDSSRTTEAAGGKTSDATALINRVADPLNEIKNCLEAIHDKSNNLEISTKDDDPTSKMETKLDPALIVMFK